MLYHVSVKPGSKKEEIVIKNDQITIRTPKRPHDGEANKAVISLLSKTFKTAKGNIKIVKGQTSKTKLVEIN